MTSSNGINDITREIRLTGTRIIQYTDRKNHPQRRHDDPQQINNGRGILTHPRPPILTPLEY